MWDKMADYLRTNANTLPQRPKAIVMVSAHWVAPSLGISGHEQPPLIFDYYGFPEHTYQLKYPAHGSVGLASQIHSLLAQAHIASHIDPHRGFDHGMFVPMLLMFPNADIPVVQLSLHDSLDPVVHLKIGKALTSLRDEGILIIGSGMSFHNMRGYGDPRFGPISDVFDAWLRHAVCSPAPLRQQALAQWADAPSAQLCHPLGAQEHLLPLMVVAGAAADDPGRTVFTDRVLETTLSGFCFG